MLAKVLWIARKVSWISNNSYDYAGNIVFILIVIS